MEGGVSVCVHYIQINRRMNGKMCVYIIYR